MSVALVLLWKGKSYSSSDRPSTPAPVDRPLFPLAHDSLYIQPLPILPALFAIRSKRHHLVATSLRLLATHLALQVGNACDPYFPISLLSLQYPPDSPASLPLVNNVTTLPTVTSCSRLSLRSTRLSLAVAARSTSAPRLDLSHIGPIQSDITCPLD